VLEKEKKEEEIRKIEEIWMLEDIPNDPLVILKLHSWWSYLYFTNYVCDPTMNVNQVGFGSYIANYVIKKLNRYRKESMVPPNLGNVWEPRIYVTIGKITWPNILDLESSILGIPKSLCG
jgi:hypothetical protein